MVWCPVEGATLCTQQNNGPSTPRNPVPCQPHLNVEGQHRVFGVGPDAERVPTPINLRDLQHRVLPRDKVEVPGPGHAHRQASPIGADQELVHFALIAGQKGPSLVGEIERQRPGKPRPVLGPHGGLAPELMVEGVQDRKDEQDEH